MQYRIEIDGLRALAVIPVIFFHAGFKHFSGGYIGVDVFFVISGYLITSIIADDIIKNRFSLLYFYERRARRILPALFTVLFFCVLFGWVYLGPVDFYSLSKSIVAVSTFSSNILFYLESGYFAPRTDELPLIHTWSLAIEEQFYVIYPLLLLFLWRFRSKILLSMLLVIFIASLCLAEYFSTSSRLATFYLIHTRAWELLAGALLALYTRNDFSPGKRVSEVGSFLGLLMVITPVFFYDRNTPFPSLYALLPVAGTLLILCLAGNRTFVGKLLGNKLFVFTGLISYSLYLWHQPLFAFLRIKTVGEPDVIVFLVAITVAYLAAVLSWRYIEKPFRNRKNFSRKSIFIYSVGTSAIFILLGFSGYYFKGFPDRYGDNPYSKTAISSPKRDACHTTGEDYLPPSEACEYFGEEITWAILGDSHVTETGYALAKRLQKENKGLLHLSFSDCPPAYTFKTNLPGCTRWLHDAVSEIIRRDKIKKVFIGFRHGYHLYGNHSEVYPELPSLNPARIFKSPEKWTRGSAQEKYWQSFKKIIDTLRKAGKTVYVLYPVPEIPMNIHKGIHPFSIFNSTPVMKLHNTTSLSFYNRRHEFILSKLNSLKFDDHLIAIRPTEVLCSESHCHAVIGGETMYFDDDHPSLSGANRIAGLLVR